jgi:succinate dehydrogenase flavin-adding protein (antitoxin of CptAB toxin-antitoxin module)
MQSIFILVAFLIILFIVVVLIHKFLRFAGTILMYVITIGIIITIIALIFVQVDFSKFADELEEKNLFLAVEDDKIVAAFDSKPFDTLTAEEIAALNSDKTIWLDGRYNAFSFNRDALEAVHFETVNIGGEEVTKSEAVVLVFSSSNQDEKNLAFSELLEEYDSDYFKAQLKKGNIDALPNRAMYKFMRKTPNFFSDICSFKNEVK